jgi:hypothetical protein
VQQRLIALGLLIGIVLPMANAESTEVDSLSPAEMTIGDDGFLSSFLTLGPMTSSELDKIGAAILTQGTPSADVRVENKTWTVTHFASSSVDFSAKRNSAVVLYARLKVNADLRVLLSTAGNGPIQIILNTKTVQLRDVSRKVAADTDLTSLSLQQGDNDLFIILKNMDVQRIRATVRLMNEDFSRADALRAVLPGVSEDVSQILSATGVLKLVRKIDFSKKAITVNPVLVFEGGYPVARPTAISTSVKFADGSLTDKRDVQISSDKKGRIDLGEYVFTADPLPMEISASMGAARFSRRLYVRFQDVSRLISANDDLTAAQAAGPVERTTLESLSWRISHLTSLIEAGDEDAMYIHREIEDTRRMTSSLKKGADPYFNRRGQIQRRGYRSSLDGSLQPYALYVPQSWREEGDSQYGLLVALHGLNSTPMKTIQTVFGIPLAEGETKQQQDRYPQPVSPAPMFVLAPDGFGNSNYRAFGEKDVQDTIEQVASRYRIDPNRIYITGASMGGIGAASLPLHYPDRFAAAAPLCGYHSMFLYRGVLGKNLLPFERFLLESHSNAYWAANGRYVPMYIVHGLQDSPQQSRVLVNAYRDAGYTIAYDTPDLGHNVWDLTYEKGRIFPYFAPNRREAHPRKVTFHTPTLRYPSSYYLQIDEMEHFGLWAKVDADWQKNNTIWVRTENIARLTVVNDEELRGEEPIILQIDETSIPLPKEALDWRLIKEKGQWQLAENDPSPAGRMKRHGLSGPIGDALFEPLLFVYGTSNKAEETLSLRLIEQMRDDNLGVSIDWPVKADRDVTDEDLASKSIVIVGTPKGNSLLQKMADRLPIKVTDNAIVIGSSKFEGRTKAAAFIYPNPLNPDRYVTIYTGVSTEALYYVNHLPDMLPDYVVFDGSSWATKNGRILDSREILTAGFFDGNWAILGL